MACCSLADLLYIHFFAFNPCILPLRYSLFSTLFCFVPITTIITIITSDQTDVRNPVLLLPLHPPHHVQHRDRLARPDQPGDRPRLVLLLLGSVCSCCGWGQDQHRAGQSSGPQSSGTPVLQQERTSRLCRWTGGPGMGPYEETRVLVLLLPVTLLLLLPITLPHAPHTASLQGGQGEHTQTSTEERAGHHVRADDPGTSAGHHGGLH